MSNKEEKLDKKYSMGLYACLALIVIQVIGQALTLVSVQSTRGAILPVTLLILLIGFAYYALVWYKKPHGNSLKYLILFYVAFAGFLLIYYTRFYSLYFNLIGLVKIIALSYVAGRLDRVKENKIIFGILVVMDLVYVIYNISLYSGYGALSFNSITGFISPLSFTAIIALAYISRYKEHKEAGLEEK